MRDITALRGGARVPPASCSPNVDGRRRHRLIVKRSSALDDAAPWTAGENKVANPAQAAE
jgi:hypothetical protein